MSTSAKIQKSTLYLKIEQNTIVYQRAVRLSDIAKMEGADESVIRELGQLEIYHFTGQKKDDQIKVITMLYIFGLIHKQYPELQLVNLGVSEFVIRYVPNPEKKWIQYMKVAVLSVILFFGAAFSIMTFIQDVAVPEMFDRLYYRLTGETPAGLSILEISFSIGLTVGIIVFYNHLGRKKITADPTPIQVALRKYEQDIDTTLIETSNRKGDSVDVK